MIADPDSEIYLVEQLEYVLLLCDGVFEVLTEQQIDVIVLTCLKQKVDIEAVDMGDVLAKSTLLYLENEEIKGDEVLSEYCSGNL